VTRLRVKHSTGYAYDGEVSASYNEARMLPLSTPGQFVLYSQLQIHPVSSSHSYDDYWGTRVRAFELLTPHQELSLTATSLVEVHHDPAGRGTGIGWADLEASAIDVAEQRFQTPLTAPHDEVAALAAELAGAARTPGEAASAISDRIGDAMEYMAGVTGVHSTAHEAWAERRGVCQDIAHVTIGALRSVGIPARYVSGYLHPVPDAQIGQTVAGESHAWVEWYDGAWIGHDPTNLIGIGERHVVVGRGRDYRDVAPLRGVYAGSSGSRLFVSVEITKEA